MYPERLFACLLRQKEQYEHEGTEFDERCSRVIVQRLRVRALGLYLCLYVCVPKFDLSGHKKRLNVYFNFLTLKRHIFA